MSKLSNFGKTILAGCNGDMNDLLFYLYTEDAASTHILRDTIYPAIEEVLRKPEGYRAFMKLVEGFIDRNSEKLHEPCPISMIAFTDADKAQYFNLFNLDEKVVVSQIKGMLKQLSAAASFKTVSQNPILVVFYCCIRYFTVKKDKTGLNVALTIYALAAYPSKYYKYFKYGTNEGVMRYTADKLTDKFIFKIAGNTLGALTMSINSSYAYLKPFFIEMEDKEVVRFIQRVGNDQNSLIKKIAIQYHDNYKKGNYITVDIEKYDTGDLIDDRQNDTSAVEVLADRITTSIITSGLDLRVLSTAAQWSKISMVELKIYILQIIINPKAEELKAFISAVLFIYLYNERHKIDDIHSKEFLAYGISLFRRTNSNDPNVSTIKNMLDKWGNDTGLHSKFRREHTQSDYKKGIFWYIVLSIQHLT